MEPGEPHVGPLGDTSGINHVNRQGVDSGPIQEIPVKSLAMTRQARAARDQAGGDGDPGRIEAVGQHEGRLIIRPESNTEGTVTDQSGIDHEGPLEDHRRGESGGSPGVVVVRDRVSARTERRPVGPGRKARRYLDRGRGCGGGITVDIGDDRIPPIPGLGKTPVCSHVTDDCGSGRGADGGGPGHRHSTHGGDWEGCIGWCIRGAISRTVRRCIGEAGSTHH